MFVHYKKYKVHTFWFKKYIHVLYRNTQVKYIYVKNLLNYRNAVYVLRLFPALEDISALQRG